MESVIVFLWLMWRCWKVFFSTWKVLVFGCGWCPTYFQQTTKPIVPPPTLPLPLFVCLMGSWKTTWATFRLNNGGFLKDPRKTGNKKTPTGEKNPWGSLRHVSCFFSFRWPDFFLTVDWWYWNHLSLTTKKTFHQLGHLLLIVSFTVNLEHMYIYTSYQI